GRQPGAAGPVDEPLGDEGARGLPGAVDDGRPLPALHLPAGRLQPVGEVGVLAGADVLAEAAELLEHRAAEGGVRRLREAPAPVAGPAAPPARPACPCKGRPRPPTA